MKAVGNVPCTFIRWFLSQSCQHGQELGTRHLFRTKTQQVMRSLLAIDKSKSPFPQQPDTVHKSNLGCIRTPVKHGFAEENPPDGNTVQTADQIPVFPRFEAMRPPGLMQLRVCPYHLRHQPSSRAITTRCICATKDHASKRFIRRHLKFSAIEHPAQRFRNMQIIRDKNESGIGRPPKNGITRSVPWENPPGVRLHQTLERQVAAKSQQSIGRSLHGIGEPQFSGWDVINGHTVNIRAGASTEALTPA